MQAKQPAVPMGTDTLICDAFRLYEVLKKADIFFKLD